ncbi:MAG: SAM-dependent methyltransferase [Oligoflexia bacterium]|nr:SAM-dependent methyltransferase [Oligoflexia bacterium]
MRPFRSENISKPRGTLPFAYPSIEVPLDVEVGCGVGWHPIRYVRENPKRTLVAIEHTRTRFSRFERRIASHDPLPNLHPVHADAVKWITHFLRPATVDRYFFLYPNPRPKPWYSMPFFARVVETLKVGGTVTLATNESFYYVAAKNYFTRVWGLEIVSDRSIAPIEKPRTHFEKKYLSRGESCFDLVVRKS